MSYLLVEFLNIKSNKQGGTDMYKVTDIIKAVSTTDSEELFREIREWRDSLEDYEFIGRVEFFKKDGETEPLIAYLHICQEL